MTIKSTVLEILVAAWMLGDITAVLILAAVAVLR